MMKTATILLIIFLFVDSVFSFESQDTNISDKLLDIYGDNITVDQLDKVLEFNKDNSEALYVLAKIMDRDDVSLFYPLELLKKSGIHSTESKYHYISILYRLGHYHEVVKVSLELDIFNITDVDIIYYISDSLLRIKQTEKASALLSSGLHQYPEDLRLHELRYLIENINESLKFIRLQEYNTDSLFRLYSRTTNKRSKSLLSKIITKKIEGMSINELHDSIYNINVIDDFIKYFDIEAINGSFMLDNDCNTFSDGYLDVVNGRLQRSSKDKDRDGLIDLEYTYIDREFNSIDDDKNRIEYSDYPYIDKIELGSESKDVYFFHKYKVMFSVENQLEPAPLEEILNLVDNKYVRRVENYINNDLVKVIEKRNDNTEVIYLEPHDNGWGHCLLVRNSVVLSGVKDIDSDGIYEIHEEYNNGVLINSHYIYESNIKINKNLKDWWK